ncbi:MAG: hypothetical protein C4542_07415 [Dehalococcoidia bacterium]|nr:MAG: hypothetical protein C4542_07415 [Dehalococcoidia bacterium]
MFVILLAVGLAGLLIAFLFDLDGDLDHDGPQLANMKVIAAFLAAFGGFGQLARYAGFGIVGAAGYGVLAGLCFGALMVWMLRVISRQQSTSHVQTADVFGRTGVVTVQVGPGLTAGEVVVNVGGNQQTFVARAGEPYAPAYPVGTRVILTTFIGDQVLVKPSIRVKENHRGS